MFSLICVFRYILDKLSLQAGLETQSQLASKLEEASARVKSLESELEELKHKDGTEEVSQEPVEDTPPPPVEETEVSVKQEPAE